MAFLKGYGTYPYRHHKIHIDITSNRILIVFTNGVFTARVNLESFLESLVEGDG